MMIRISWIGILFFVALSSTSEAQLRIDKHIRNSTSFDEHTTPNIDSIHLDTLVFGSISTTTWDKYTSKFGKSIEFGVYATLPDPGFSYKLVSWNLPFYGGGYQSGGLREAGLIARLWSGIHSTQSVNEDSILVQTSAKTLKIGSFEYRMAEFLFSKAPFFRGVQPIGLSILYDTGPDSLAISPIWTRDTMVNEMFYSRLIPLTDSTVQRKYADQTEFWSSYKVDGNVFGQLSGYIVIERDTSKTENLDPNNSGPLGTGLNEKWYLPGSHNVIGNFPNPFNPTTTLRIIPQFTGHHDLKIHDITGRLVYEKSLTLKVNDEYFLDLVANNWSSGVYLVSIHTSSYRWIHSITFVK
jgi:hypothetical protein